MPFFLPVRPAFPPAPEAARPGVGSAFSAFAEAEREFRKLLGILVDIFQPGTRGNQDRKGKQKERATEREAVESYMRLRSLDQERSFLFNIPSKAWTSLLEFSALKEIPSSSSISVTDIITRDLVDCLSSRRPEDYQQVILDVFDLVSSPAVQITISDRQALDLFHSLPPSLDPQQYTTAMITRVFEAMLNDSDAQFTIHLPFLTTAYQGLISSTKAQSAATQSQSAWLLFRFIERLSRPASQPHSLRGKAVQYADGLVFDILANVAGAGIIPNSIAATALASAQSALSTSAPAERAEAVRVGVLGALVSTCFRKGWHAQAIGLLSSVVDAAPAYAIVQRGQQARGGQFSQRMSQPEELSSIMVDYLRETVVNLLTFSTPADFEVASALLVSLVEVLQSHPECSSSIPSLIKMYYTSTAPLDTSTMATAFVYDRLAELEIDLAHRIPPRDMQSRLLRAYLQAKSVDQAKRLILDVLEYDRQVCNSQQGLAGLADMETDFILGITDVGDVESLNEIWRGAEAGWAGYSKLSICGSRTILNAIAKQFGEAGQRMHSSRSTNLGREDDTMARPGQPSVVTEFAQHALSTFADIHLRWPTRAAPEDLKAYNNACRALGFPDKVIKPVRSSKAQTTSQRSPSTLSPKPSNSRSSTLFNIDHSIHSMHPSRPLEERKSAAKQVIKLIRREGAWVAREGSDTDVQLRHLAAAVALDACWPPDVWATLLGDNPHAPWSKDLRIKISRTAFVQWKNGELEEAYCLKTLRHLRSRWAREIWRARSARNPQP